MKKLILLFTASLLFSCSSDDTNCPDGKIKGKSNIQDRCFLTLSNGNEIDIPCTDFDKYKSNSCFEGLK